MKKIYYPKTYIPKDSNVVAKRMGKYAAIAHNNRKKRECFARRISKDLYEVTSTKEQRLYRHTISRSENAQSLAATANRLHGLVLSNVIDTSKCLGVTVTYAEIMQDFTKLSRDCTNFRRRLKNLVGSYKYISVTEFQERGALHVHFILLFDHVVSKIDIKRLKKAWNFGSVYLSPIKNALQLANYLTKNMRDMPLEDAEKLIGENVNSCSQYVLVDANGNEHTYVKSAGIFLYPTGKNIFSSSRGLKRMEIIKDVRYSDILDQLGECKQVYRSNVKMFFSDEFDHLYLHDQKEMYQLLSKDTHDQKH